VNRVTVIASLLLLAGLSLFSVHHADVRPSGDHLVINEVALYTLDPKARWFELYNPTDKPICLTNWSYYFTFIDAYAWCLFAPNLTVPPRGYVVFTPSIKNFTAYWGVHIENVYQAYVPYNPKTYIYITRFEQNETLVDSMGGPPPRYILNHSWARYRGGYDTDNFTDDFYDEPYPTPGRENYMVKAMWTDAVERWLFVSALLCLGVAALSYLSLLPRE